MWGVNYKSNLNKICIHQQQIIRLINKTPNCIHNIYIYIYIYIYIKIT